MHRLSLHRGMMLVVPRNELVGAEGFQFSSVVAAGTEAPEFLI